MKVQIKKQGEDLQEYLNFKRKHHTNKIKKGKGSYYRKNYKKISAEDF